MTSVPTYTALEARGGRQDHERSAEENVLRR